MTTTAASEKERVLSPIKRARDFAVQVGVGALALYGAAEGARFLRSSVLEYQRREAIPTLDQSEEVDQRLSFGLSPDRNRLSEVSKISDATGFEFSVVNYFLDDHTRHWYEVSHWIDEVTNDGNIPMISWGRPANLFGEELEQEEIARRQQYMSFAGLFTQELDLEEELHVFARRLRDKRVPIYFRPYFEMNGDWFSYGPQNITAEQFREGWIKLFTIFQEEGATNVEWVYSPNITVYANDFRDTYPGDMYVHHLSLDIYDKSTTNRRDVQGYYFSPYLSPEATIGPDLDALLNLSPDKDVIISELGSLENENWMVDSILFLSRYSRVRCIMFFVWKKSGSGETDWQRELQRVSVTRLQGNSRIRPSIREEILMRKFLHSYVGEKTMFQNREFYNRIFSFLLTRDRNSVRKIEQEIVLKNHAYSGIDHQKSRASQIRMERRHGNQQNFHTSSPKGGILYINSSPHPWKKLG